MKCYTQICIHEVCVQKLKVFNLMLHFAWPEAQQLTDPIRHGFLDCRENPNPLRILVKTLTPLPYSRARGRAGDSPHPARLPRPCGKTLTLLCCCVGLEAEQVTDPIRHVFLDFKLAQIKALSFLTYLLRTFPQLTLPLLQQLPDALVQLMLNCPEVPTMRKELLVTARHTFTTNHRW